MKPNFPAWNKRLLEEFHESRNSQYLGDGATLACRMEAALRLVLIFYTADWTSEKRIEWDNLQVEAGVEHLKPATTRGLCDVIREVLGEKNPFEGNRGEAP